MLISGTIGLVRCVEKLNEEIGYIKFCCDGKVYLVFESRQLREFCSLIRVVMGELHEFCKYHRVTPFARVVNIAGCESFS